MEKQTKKMSIGELARHFDKDRRTVAAVLEEFPFTLGENRAHEYDFVLARKAIESKDADVAEFLHERLLKVRAERELREIQLKEKKKELVPSASVAEFFAVLIRGLQAMVDEWPKAHRQKALLHINRVGVEAYRACGIDTNKAEKELAKAELQCEAESSKIPHHWAKTARPANSARIWSQELHRYLTKAEIIAKFGLQPK